VQVALARIVKTLVVVLILAIAIMMYPPLRLAAMVIAGRSPECPIGHAVKADRNLKDQIETKDRILHQSTMIGKDDHYEQWQTPLGTYWIDKDSRYVLPFNLAEQQRRIYGHGEHFVRPGDIVLDCGANIGVFVRSALNAGAQKVIAIEPAPENLECLRRNFKREVEQNRVVIYPKGVWDRDDFLTLNITHGNSAADSFVITPEHSAASADKLPLTTIDKLVAELGLPRVDFIKMDIEGAEVKALNGARQTIAKYHPRMALSVYHEPEHPVEVPKAVKAAWDGYRMECGPCAVEHNRIRPDIDYFYP
jgi:FkbM family methyltransferase